VTVRWRPPRIGLFLILAWLVGSTMISAILALQTAGSHNATLVAFGIWGVVFVVATYVVLALAINSTKVRVEGDKLVVSSGPLPGGGSSCTDVREIEDVYTASFVTSGARGFGGLAYKVLARTKTKGVIPVVAMSNLDADVAEDVAREVQAMIWKSHG
jgi:hypothetical protein